ncbi:hypothetical protein [Streptomyces sp. NPDC057702]|uniref:hypothetical protein n=1 Tax=unclassified Streptomyces TaxID=2593676 RepID=UPI0036B2B142
MDDVTDTGPAPEPGPTPEPPPLAREDDPLAAALGNASLLGVGYLLLRRPGLACAHLLVTVGLVATLMSLAAVWCELALVAWWVAGIAHGWFLGTRGAGRLAARGRRLTALGATALVLLTVGWLRFDAVGIERDVTEARERGDCAAVLAARDTVAFGHRLADAPGTERGEATAEACRRLGIARGELARGLRGDSAQLASGFDTLAEVLAEPGHDATVGSTLDGFLGRLPLADACATAEVTDWLRARNPRQGVLGRTAATVRRVAPDALVTCAEDLGQDKDWRAARDRYQQLVDGYPGDPRTGRAREGIHRATLSLELAHVRDLLGDGSYGEQPSYCSAPAGYSAAPAARAGATNRALFYGNETYTDQLPRSWRAGDVAKAALVVCAGETRDDDAGTAVQTCPYQTRNAPHYQGDVTFRKIAVPVRVYALRTGELVSTRTVQIGGTSCPPSFRSDSGLLGPPSDTLVDASPADVRAAFEPLVRRQ